MTDELPPLPDYPFDAEDIAILQAYAREAVRATWNDAIEAAAILAQESEGKDQIHERILVLKR